MAPAPPAPPYGYAPPGYAALPLPDPNSSSQVFKLPPAETEDDPIRRRAEGGFPLAPVIIGLGGLGHMGVKIAHAMGAHVTVITTSPNKDGDAKTLGADAVIVSSDPAQVKALFAATKAAFGRLDVLFNNAGLGTRHTLLEDLTFEQWMTVVNANLTDADMSGSEYAMSDSSETPRSAATANRTTSRNTGPRQGGRLSADSIGWYLSNIGRVPLLNAEEEVILAKVLEFTSADGRSLSVELFFDELGANVVAALDRGKGPGLLGCHCFLLVFCEARVRIEL